MVARKPAAKKTPKTPKTPKTSKTSKTSKSPKLAKLTVGAALTTVDAVLEALKRQGTKANRDGLARYGIEAPRAFGVPMTGIHALAKRTGTNHALAAALWKSGWYEARLLAAFVADPARVTSVEMDRWVKDFDNWAVCDTACFHLFDRTPHAFQKIREWSKRPKEFEKRAGFALLASVALHDRAAPDREFLRCLPLLEKGATDPRNFVKKAVVWALRGVGGRNHALAEAALAVAERLAQSVDPTARWVGKGTLRELASPAAKRRLASRAKRAEKASALRALRAR